MEDEKGHGDAIWGKREKERDGETFFNETQVNIMIQEVYKGDMCHSLMEDAPKTF